jgi:hypothetical protein
MIDKESVGCVDLNAVEACLHTIDKMTDYSAASW